MIRGYGPVYPGCTAPDHRVERTVGRSCPFGTLGYMSSQPGDEQSNQPPQQPQYGQPQYGQPQYGEPQNAQPPEQAQYAPPMYAPPGYAQQPPTQQGPTQQAPTPKTPIWLALISLILGILSLFFWIVPWLGATIAVIAIVAGIISRKKRWRKGLALSGIITGGVGVLLVIAFLGLYQFSQYQLGKMEQQNISDQKAQDEKAKADEEARYAQSEWIDEARSEADFDSFVELDAATLEAIAADPDAYQGEGYVLNASMGEPYIHETMWAQGMCLVGFEAAPVVGEIDWPIEAVMSDRGGEDGCPLLERLTGSTDQIPSMGALMTQNRMWVTVAGALEGDGGEITPMFILMQMEDTETE